jgi:hypothetical protein
MWVGADQGQFVPVRAQGERAEVIEMGGVGQEVLISIRAIGIVPLPEPNWLGTAMSKGRGCISSRNR